MYLVFFHTDGPSLGCLVPDIVVDHGVGPLAAGQAMLSRDVFAQEVSHSNIVRPPCVGVGNVTKGRKGRV